MLNDKIIFNSVDNGIIILDKDLNILAWNKWLEIFTKLHEKDVINKNICELFEYVDKKRLQRKIRSVLVTNNPSFYSVDPHQFLIDIKLNSITNVTYTSMQQSVTIVPYNLENEQVCIYIYNNTNLCEINAKLQSLNEELEDMSHRDPLTHLYNRRYFTEQSNKIQSFSKRNNHPLSVITLDIDKFKNINDTYGHLTGDEVIIQVARTLESIVRNSDIIARFGGEEFVILVQNSDLDKTLCIAEKIRKEIEICEINTQENESIKFTASFGVAQFDEELDNDNIERTLNRADNALYVAKKNGRNQCIPA